MHQYRRIIATAADLVTIATNAYQDIVVRIQAKCPHERFVEGE